MNNSNGILQGVFELADDWLELSFKAQLPLYRHTTAAAEIFRRHRIPSAYSFLHNAYEQIDKNWNRSVADGSYSHSAQNWRFTKNPDISPQNTSAEVRLERAIISAASDNWANQVPTSSGLAGPRSDKLRNVDLIQRDESKNYTLIELKVDSNNPLFAAVEIISYGLLLAWSKKNISNLSYDVSLQPVLEAIDVQLCVLAPSNFYDGYRCGILERAINDGLSEAQYLFGTPFSFVFTRFGDEFDIEDSAEALLEAAISREVIAGDI